MLLTDALWHPLPAVSHLLRSKGAWCVRAGAQLCAKATRWLLKNLQPQTLLLTNLLIWQEIHPYPILSCWTYNIKVLSFRQRSQSIPSSISYPGNLSLWFPAQILFLISTNWLMEGNSVDISSKSMAQRLRETNTYSKWASKQGWVDQVATERFETSLSSQQLKCKEKRQNHGLYLEEKKTGMGKQRGTPASELWRQTGSQEGDSWEAQRWGQAFPQPSLISKILRKVFALSICFLTTFNCL